MIIIITIIIFLRTKSIIIISKQLKLYFEQLYIEPEDEELIEPERGIYDELFETIVFFMFMLQNLYSLYNYDSLVFEYEVCSMKLAV